MRTPKEQSGDTFVEKLRLLKLEDRSGVHDRIDALLAQRRRPPEKPLPAPLDAEAKPGRTMVSVERVSS
jgi:hypothetical protein